MELTEKDIQEFKKLYKENYGEDINDFVAYEAANHLINMVRAVYKPIPKADEELYYTIRLKKSTKLSPKMRSLILLNILSKMPKF